MEGDIFVENLLVHIKNKIQEELGILKEGTLKILYSSAGVAYLKSYPISTRKHNK